MIPSIKNQNPKNESLNEVTHFDSNTFNGWYISLSNVEFKHIKKYILENDIEIIEMFLTVDKKSISVTVDKFNFDYLKKQYKDSDVMSLVGFRKDSVCFHVR